MSFGFRFGLFGYLLCALLAAAVCGALFETNRRVEASWKLIAADVASLEALSRFGQESSAAEAAHRGWALSRITSFRDERDEALAKARAALGDLRSPMIREARMHVWADQLEMLLQRRQDVMIRGEQMLVLGEPPAGVMQSIAAAAREADRHLLEARDRMRRSLLADLATRREGQRVASQRAKAGLAAALATMLLVLFPLYFILLREAKARERAEAWLRDVTESVPAAVFRLRRRRDGATKYEFVSRNAQEIRGVSREALMQDHQAAITSVVEEDRPAVAGALQQASARLEPYERQYRVRLADGRVRWVMSSAHPRAEPDGSILWHGYWTDITCRRELEQQLVDARDRAERASKAKSDFLAVMSHEIRTPMTGVMGMVELLARNELNDDQRISVEIIRESSAALLRIIDDVLDLSRIEAGKVELRRAPARLDAIAARVAELYAAAATDKGLRLERSIGASLGGYYHVDAVRVQQVLSNLVSNAIKFTTHGEVMISLVVVDRGTLGDVLAFDVRDTGPGISAEDQARLFAPYEQAGDALMRSQGSGLGLSISRSLAELMGGSLRLQSTRGSGTCMRFVLPASRVAVPADAARAECMAPRKVDASRSGRILVIDDDEVTRMVIQRQLATLGHQAESAGSAEEGLERCATTAFSLILVDCNMSPMDGYEFTRLLRASELRRGARRIPVIACTARVFDGDATASREAGTDDHLRKPAGLEQLDAMVRRWIAPLGETVNRA
jgi:two-component system sensor histidine kinase EvgS